MKFSLKYEGKAIDNHSIDLLYLTKALVGINKILVKSNEALNYSKNKIKIEVRALKPGSFICEFYTQIVSFHQLLNSEELVKAKDLLIFLFGNGTFGVLGLLELIRKTKGESPNKIENKGDGNVTITYNNYGKMTVNKTVYNLSKNKEIRKGCDSLVSPLENDGIDRLTADAGKDAVFVTNKEERRYFTPPKSPKNPKEPQVYQTRVQIINLSFKEKKQWIVNDGGHEFSAVIEDSVFLQKIDNNKEQFSKGSMLTITLREEQFEDDERNLTKKYFIEKVLEHKKPDDDSEPLEYE